MPFDISEFKSQIQSGFSRTCYFYMNITPPNFWGNNGGDTSFLSYLCSGSQIPGIIIQSQDVPIWGYGPTRKIPTNVIHPDITLTIYSDGEGNAIDFFNQWTRNIVSYGDINLGVNGSPFGLVQYPDNYLTDINLYYMSENGSTTELIRYVFLDAFPMGTGDINLNWADSGNIAQFVVPFNYRTYYMIKNQVDFSTGSIIPNASYYNGIFTSLGISDMQSISSGFIGINGLTSSLSVAFQSLLNNSGIGQKIQSIGGIVQGDLGALNSNMNLAFNI